MKTQQVDLDSYDDQTNDYWKLMNFAKCHLKQVREKKRELDNRIANSTDDVKARIMKITRTQIDTEEKKCETRVDYWHKCWKHTYRMSCKIAHAEYLKEHQNHVSPPTK